MAGTGPAPAEQKRRRNKDQFEELPAEGYQGDFPKLPKTYRVERTVWVKDKDSGKKVPETKVFNVAYLRGTRDWYETWARSPMAIEFTGVDWQRLQRIARLVDAYERSPSKELLAEIRLQEAGFGGTPLDRRRMGRKIGERAAATAAPAKRRKASGRRARLSVVK
jgi:hypothetical protein